MPKERRQSQVQIDNLTKAIEKLLTKEVLPVAPVAPVAPILPLPERNPDDHNLLIKLDTKVDALKEDIRILSDGTSMKITDHEIRLRSLEQRIWLFVGGLTILTFLVPYIIGAF